MGSPDDVIQMLDLEPQHAPLRAELAAAFERVVTSNRYIMGPDVDAFERELAEYIGVRHVVAVSSGTDALVASLMALGVGPGHEVVTTANTFIATAEAIARVGARPVFADIERDGFNLDPHAAEAACTRQTRAVIPVSLFGEQAKRPRVSLPIIEDAAQSIGSGALRGMAGTLSFFPSKNLGGMGDGGAVYTDHGLFAAEVRLRRNHGSGPRYTHSVIGGNMRLDAMQAAILRVKLPHLDDWTAQRRANADRYRAMIAATPAIPHDVALPLDHSGHVWNQFVIRTPRRDQLRAHMHNAGVLTEVYYPTPLHLQPCFAHLGYKVGSLPYAELAAREVLGLPIYPGLTEARQARVVGAIASFFTG